MTLYIRELRLVRDGLKKGGKNILESGSYDAVGRRRPTLILRWPTKGISGDAEAVPEFKRQRLGVGSPRQAREEEGTARAKKGARRLEACVIK